VSGFRCQVSGVSPAAGLKSGKFDRIRNSEKANIELMYSVYLNGNKKGGDKPRHYLPIFANR
jgi:hypothetical protein